MRGFSIGEVLLSVAVLIVGVLPVFASLSKGYQVSVTDRRIIIGSGLAQEGVELVQGVRNNRILDGGTFEDWLPANVGSQSSWSNCRIDIRDDALDIGSTSRITCGVGDESGYRLSLGSGDFLEHAGGEGLYHRRILLSYNDPDDGGDGTARVLAVVYWNDAELDFVNDGRFDGLKGDCTSKNECVYAESRLAPW